MVMAWFNRFVPNRFVPNRFVPDRVSAPDSFLNAVSTNRADSSRLALANFVKGDRSLQAAITRHLKDMDFSRGTVPERNAVADVLTRYGMAVAEKGDYTRAASALLFALLVVPDYLEAVANMAIIYHAWEDRIAALWATHFRELTEAESPRHSYRMPGEVSPSHTEFLRQQMVGIVFDCEQHPEWRDSSTGRQKYGMEH